MFINPLTQSNNLHMYVILTDFCIICIEFKFVFGRKINKIIVLGFWNLFIYLFMMHFDDKY